MLNTYTLFQLISIFKTSQFTQNCVQNINILNDDYKIWGSIYIYINYIILIYLEHQVN